MATTSEMAMEYRMKAEMYRDMAMEAAGMRGLEITILANKIINQSAIDNAELEGKTGHDVPEPISNAKRVGAALAAAAAATPVNAAGNPHQGSDATTAANNVATATATFTGAAPKITTTINTIELDRGETPLALEKQGFQEQIFAGTESVRRDSATDSSDELRMPSYSRISIRRRRIITSDCNRRWHR